MARKLGHQDFVYDLRLGSTAKNGDEKELRKKSIFK
jgi:hypothetical protein